MDQRSIVLYLNRKDLTAQVTHDDLVATLGAEAIAYSTVTNYLRTVRIIHRDATPLSATTSLCIDVSDEVILRALEEFPFSSVRQLAHATHLPVTTVYRRLSAKLWFTHVISDGCRISCPTFRRQHGSNVLGPCWRCCQHKKPELGTTS
jgi:hypothetical protein